ncbi:protein CPR-5-like isoform X1 [Olea europaea var. sylvestris]|uniref:protein CPR-5-like isoform X1 n=1 Tax=Olea europaea var. sylvestris TaxID=158386 RepID=UPI000C1D47A0|nr:protein CPR-5-like isoform X1 [Olea europaea var. sylvestris]
MESPPLQPLHCPTEPSAVNDGATAYSVPEIPSDPSSSRLINGTKSERKNNKKKKTLVTEPSSPPSSVSSSNNCSCSSSKKKGLKILKNSKKIRVGSTTNRRSTNFRNVNVDTLALPLGMSIAAVVSKVLDQKNASGEKISVDYLTEICIFAVRESLANVFGDKFDGFVRNFATSFRSTFMTLRLIYGSSQNVKGDGRWTRSSNNNKFQDPVCISDTKDGLESIPHANSRDEQICTHEHIEEDRPLDLINRQLVLHDGHTSQQLACSSSTTSYSEVNQLMISTFEKSVIEQTRSNDLKAFEITLAMKKLQLKEAQLAVHSDANFLERCKISMGFSKASFKAEKFKTQLLDTRQVELLKKCLDVLVAGLITMLLSLGYGAYVYSHRRITEATESCSPFKETKSWWMPKSMATFSSGLQLLRCQVQVLSRMLFAGLMIGAIAFLLIQRSAVTNQTMPITFIMLLLGVGCGYAGKFCIDTLGGSGNHWLMYWEVLCLLHFLSNIWTSALFLILYGSINVSDKVKDSTIFPYWIRRFMFFTTLLLLPLLCGFMPFASPGEWINHFSSRAIRFVSDED